VILEDPTLPSGGSVGVEVGSAQPTGAATGVQIAVTYMVTVLS
jgi:hypothetical protein